MSNNIGAIPLILVLILGFALSFPDEVNVGIIILEALKETTEPGTFAYEVIEMNINSLQIYGIALLLVIILTILFLAREGRYF